MSEKPGKGKTVRRRIKVAGEPEDGSQRVKPRTIEDLLGLERENPDGDFGEAPMYPPEMVQKFLAGQITLGDLEGISKQEQYQIAQLGHGYLTSGKLEKAKVVFEALLALDPFDAYFHMALGSVAQQDEDYREAEKRYSRALEINPFSAPTFANRGEVRIFMGRLSDGVSDLIRAVEEDKQGREPSTVRAQATLAALKDQLGSLDPEELKKKTSASAKSKAASMAAKIRARQGGRKASPRPKPRSGAKPVRPKARRPGSRKK